MVLKRNASKDGKAQEEDISRGHGSQYWFFIFLMSLMDDWLMGK